MDVIQGRTEHGTWRCRIGWHHYLRVHDDNPEMRGHGYLRCERCGKPKDPPEYGKPTYLNVYLGAPREP